MGLHIGAYTYMYTYRINENTYVSSTQHKHVHAAGAGTSIHLPMMAWVKGGFAWYDPSYLQTSEKRVKGE